MEGEQILTAEVQENPPALKVGDWIVVLLLTMIPVVNLIVLLIWAFGSGTNPNKGNFAKAALIWMLIWIVLYTLIIVLFGAAMFMAGDF